MIQWIRRQCSRCKMVGLVLYGLVKATWVQYKYGNQIGEVVEDQLACGVCKPRIGSFCPEHREELDMLMEEIND